MSKAMLIMEMPARCDCCSLIQWDEQNQCYFCGKQLDGGGFRSMDNDTFEKPDWCPLIPEPLRMGTDDTGPMGCFVAGWNGCLDELEGRT